MSDEKKVFGGARTVYVARIEKETKQQEPLVGDEISHPWDSTRGDMLVYFNTLTSMNAYHSRCLRLKTDCTVNLGVDVVQGNADSLLSWMDTVNSFGQSFLEVITRVALDFETTGNGYLEVVRGRGGKVVELYHCPAVLVTHRPRSAATRFYYRNQGETIPFAQFKPGERDDNSLLWIGNYTQADLYYGLPDWRGAMQDIELNYYAAQYNQNFFVNSGVPDIAVIVEGGSFDEKTEEQVVTFFQSNLKGYANSHRTLILPINDKEIKVRFEKLTADLKDRDGSFDKLRQACRDNILSAHGTPPRLVGVMSAAQLGGGGEVHGQLKTFQEIVIRPRQALFETKLNQVIREAGFTDTRFSFANMDTAVQEADSAYYPAMVQAGIITVDEAREEMGYEAMPAEQLKQNDAGEKSKTALTLVKSLEEFRKAL